MPCATLVLGRRHKTSIASIHVSITKIVSVDAAMNDFQLMLKSWRIATPDSTLDPLSDPEPNAMIGIQYYNLNYMCELGTTSWNVPERHTEMSRSFVAA